jgi:hypothetical protein
MGKFLERAALVLLALILVVVLVGMYSTWRDCTEAGGTTVRGLFGLECVK